jgi:5'-nucleotidase
VTYSGTVSAAMEGTLAGIRSIALSQVYSRKAWATAYPSMPPKNGVKKCCAP